MVNKHDKIDQILKHPIIVKRIEIFKSNDENEDSNLLQTIRIPKNLLFLTERLPKANYNKPIKTFTKKAENDLPELVKVKNKKKKENKISEIDFKEILNDNERKKEKDLINIERQITPKRIEIPEEIQKKIKNKAVLDGLAMISTPKKIRILDSSLDNLYSESKDIKSILPIVKNSIPSEYKYELPSINITKERNVKQM